METITAFQQAVRDIPDFPKEGIIFKDITPVLRDPELCLAILDELHDRWVGQGVDVVAGIESRGFLFGMGLAMRLGVPFVPIRKEGKLPAETVKTSYELEYGEAVIEMHKDAIHSDHKVLIHDDLLATGGTAKAAADLIQKVGGGVAGFSFLIELDFLNGREKLGDGRVDSLVNY